MASICRSGATAILSKSISLVFSANAPRTITSKVLRDLEKRPPKPKPWPYKEKRFNILHYFFDKTSARFDENSKLIVVEGPVAAGKSDFAKELASELDMLYMPEANLDMIYINDYGYDLRKLDPQLPESCRSFDVPDFLKNPNHFLAARFQIFQYSVKFSQYIDALAHIFSTGQGVVLDRSVYSDFVFAEAMYSQGYLSKLARSSYFEHRQCSLPELLRPHLVIYLDVPVNKVLENIKKRNITYEANSKVLTPLYLKEMEKQYKQNYLTEVSKDSELLVYDWSEGGEVEVVVEDIMRINFDHKDNQDPKLKDWNLPLEDDYAVLRNLYSDKKDSVMQYVISVPSFQVPELNVEPLDAEQYHQLMNNAPGSDYMKGYNAAFGDTGLLFKMKMPHRDTLPLRERVIRS